MVLQIPRIHFYEIDDQAWFPPFLREKVQACLTLVWIKRFPPFQSSSPATLVVKTLQSLLGPSIKDYTFIDFCSGAGGPTPHFEREINKALELESIENYHARTKKSTPSTTRRKDANETNGTLGTSNSDKNDNSTDTSVDFILTDIHPHIPSWRLACSHSPHLHYIPHPIDASAAPPDLLSQIHSSSSSTIPHRKPFRLYSLAFHHFSDPLARAVLKDTLRTSSGFAIFELQSRNLGSLFTVLLLGPLLWGVSWYYFWGDWVHLFWTYVVPVAPTVVVLDGIVSCLRTRERGEILRLLDEVEGVDGDWRVGWRFESGRGRHTWPFGEATWFVGVKDG
ncbi:MAG: hypothetical protein L6R36_003064 [Xanthoria steineri]|nr:MAG: hypothetical protein L6R36_003064 [Xanthoria steineri]